MAHSLILGNIEYICRMVCVGYRQHIGMKEHTVRLHQNRYVNGLFSQWLFLSVVDFVPQDGKEWNDRRF